MSGKRDDRQVNMSEEDRLAARRAAARERLAARQGARQGDAAQGAAPGSGNGEVSVAGDRAAAGACGAAASRGRRPSSDAEGEPSGRFVVNPDGRIDRTSRRPAASVSPNDQRMPQAAPARGSRAQSRGASADLSRRASGGAVRRSTPGSVDLNNPPSSRATASYASAGRKASLAPKILAGVVVIALVAGIVFGLVPFVKGLLSGGEVALGGSDDRLEVADDAVAPVSLTVTFAGDCTLGTDANFNKSTSLPAKYDEVGDPAYFMANVYDIFSTDDLTVVNLEGTLTDSTTRVDKQFAFKGDTAYTSILTSGDIEAVSLANNHSKDYGEKSYTDTIAACDAAGVPSFGYDRIAYVDVKGVKVALIGTYELAKHEGIKDELVANITEARAQGAQLVLVYFHWGLEREYVPNTTQMNLGHAAIDAGADLVVGAHPHVIQGYEVYKDRYIVYSLGNFCFGGNSNPSDKDCMIFQQTFTVTGDDVALDKQVKIIPCSISSTSSRNDYQPTPATGSEADRIMAKIEESSAKIADKAAAMAS